MNTELSTTHDREAAYVYLDEAEQVAAPQSLQLVIEAIRTDPQLADAYICAAEAMQQDTLEALVAWLAAREFARREAGDRLDSFRGDVWSSVFCRSFVRASLGYARCCLAHGQNDVALAELNALLLLDQGNSEARELVLAADRAWT